MCEETHIPYYGTYLRLGVSVRADWREVVRQASTKIAPHHRHARAVRDDRHTFYRYMLAHHKRARALYRAVATGDFS